MKPTTIAAIYFLFWFLSLFLILPFGVKTHDEAGIAKIPGQADSAPANFSMGKIVLRTSILAALFFALFWANYSYGWVTIHTFDSIFDPPDEVLK